MIRWKYVLPRLVLLLLVGLALTYGSGPLLHWSLVASGQAALGAKVEIAEVRTNWVTTSVEMENIQIADRGNPMTNLLEADRVRLDLDAAHLLRKRYVIEHADLEGVRFGTPRETSGALEVAPPSDEPTWSDQVVDSATREASQRLDAWFDNLQVQGLEKLEEELETVRLAQELSVRWPREYNEMRVRITALETRVKRLRETVERPNTNPLRLAQILSQASVDVQETLSEIDVLRGEMQRLARQVPADRQALTDAQRRDREKLGYLVELPKIDGETITDTLFGKEQVDQVEGVMSWVTWIRQIVPNPDTDFQAPRTHGVDVRFAGATEHPVFWLQEATISGSLDSSLSTTASRDFRGQLFDLSSHPQRLGRPTRLELETTGASPAIVHAEIDRTGAVKRDHFVIELPHIPMGERTIGRPDGIAMAVPAGELAVTLNLTLIDHALDGRIDLHRTGSALEVRHVAQRLGGTYVHSMLGSALESVEEIDATIHLSGSLKQPKLRLESPVGPEIASKLNETAASIVDDQLARLETKIDQQVEQQLASLEAQVGELDQLRQLVGGYSQQLSTIKENVARVTGLGRLR